METACADGCQCLLLVSSHVFDRLPVRGIFLCSYVFHVPSQFLTLPPAEMGFFRVCIILVQVCVVTFAFVY